MHRPEARRPSQLVHASNVALAVMCPVRGVGSCDNRKVLQLKEAARKCLPTNTPPLLEVMNEPQPAPEINSARLAH